MGNLLSSVVVRRIHERPVMITAENLTEAESAILAIRIDLGRDLQHANSDPAKRGGPDATLACAECGRAQWMHGTRHDTCGQFCYVTFRDITHEMIQVLRFVSSVSHEVKVACSRALNEFGGHSDVTVREAKQTCSAAFNRERARISAINARAKGGG